MTRQHMLGLLLCMLAPGCSLSSGTTASLFPDRHPLMHEAKYVRQYAVDLPRELNKTVFSEYIIEPGDTLLLLPADLDSPVRLPSDQTVQPDGSIDLGKYGRLEVVGKTVTEIEAMVQAAVKQRTPEAGFIDVRLINRQSKVFYVLGEVHTPGKYPITGSETVLDGILTAGGLNDRASRYAIILVRPDPRGCGQVLSIDYNRIVQLGNTATNYQILPGDRIYVPSKSFWESIIDVSK